jgi:hypothetical protein
MVVYAARLLTTGMNHHVPCRLLPEEKTTHNHLGIPRTVNIRYGASLCLSHNIPFRDGRGHPFESFVLLIHSHTLLSLIYFVSTPNVPLSSPVPIRSSHYYDLSRSQFIQKMQHIRLTDLRRHLEILTQHVAELGYRPWLFEHVPDLARRGVQLVILAIFNAHHHHVGVNDTGYDVITSRHH